MKNMRQQGFTLLELMIALTVGLLLIAGTVTMMGNSSNALKRHETNADMTSALRVSNETLRDNIQAAGYFGRTRFAGDIEGRTNSSGALPSISGDCYAGFYADLERYVFASDDVNPFPTTCLTDAIANYADGTDVLVVRFAKEEGLTGASGTAALDANSVYIFGNPTGGEVFRGNNPPSIVRIPYAGTYDPDIQKRLYELKTYVYFIGNPPFDDADINENALYRLSLNLSGSTPFDVELVSTDITDLQVSFGIENCVLGSLGGTNACDGSIDSYVTGGGLNIISGLPTSESIARIRTTSVGITSLSERITGAEFMSTKAHRHRDQVVRTSVAALFRSTTFQVRNSESIFPGS
ncbi:MAG: PilW family protein [Granulosicoccaceae bacterium]